MPTNNWRSAAAAGALLSTLAAGTIAIPFATAQTPTMPKAGQMMMSTKDSAMEMVGGWPEASQKAAKAMIEKYGAPQEATSTHLMWRNNGPWLWTRIDNYETAHEFPAHHTDVMEQAINYRIDPKKGTDLAAYDGSVYLRRTEGVMSARCDQEGANLLALNLANDVATGKKSVKDARVYYGKAIMAFKASGKMDAYMVSLKFTPSKSMQGDKDMPPQG